MKASYPRLKQTLFTLLGAGLASLCLFSTVFAHYAVTDTAEAHARIALYAMHVDASGSNWNDLEMEVIETATASQSYVLYNKDSNDNISEVDMTYKFVVELSQALPDGTTMILTDEAGEVTPQISQDHCVYTFTADTWLFEADQLGEKPFTLTFLSDNTNRDAQSATLSVSVSVITEQKTS